MAITDGMTGLFNNRYFHNLMEQEIIRSSRFNTIFSLLMLDVDFFKDFIDMHRHLSGDTLLRKISECIRQSIRTIDSACRYGGEEFAVILPETNLDEASTVAERIRNAVKEIKLNQQEPVTVSIGISNYPADGNHKDRIIARADTALYMAKRTGRNRIYCSSELEY